MSFFGNAPSTTAWARPPDMLQPASGASQTAAYEVTLDNLDAFLFAVLQTVPDCSSKLQFPGLKTRTVNSITYAFEAAADTRQPSVLISKARTSGNNFGKVIRNVALGLRVQQLPAVNNAESLKVLESMLLMVTSVYQGIFELITDTHPVLWASAFLEGMRYQLKRMLGVLLEYLRSSKAPKRFWGYQKLSRKLMKQPDQEASQWKPTDEGIFNFLVLLVHGWHMVSKGHIPVPASTAGSQLMSTDSSAPGPQPATQSTTAKASQNMGMELPAIQKLLTDFFSRGPEDTALLTLLLDTGRLRYSSTPERATTPSPEPPECLTYSSFGRKMLKYSIMASSLPASGSWLHGLKGSQDGAAEDTLENVNSAVHSIDLAEKNTAWNSGAVDESGQKSAVVDPELPSAAVSALNSGAASSGVASATSPDSATHSNTPSSARGVNNSKHSLVAPFSSGAKSQNKMGKDPAPSTPFDNPDDSLGATAGSNSPPRQVNTANFGYQNSGNASSTISLPDPHNSQSTGLSTSRQLLSNVNPITPASIGARSSASGTSQFQTFNQWLRPGADNSSGAASSNVASTPLASVNEVAGDADGEASKLDSKYLAFANEGTDSLPIDLGAAAAAEAARNRLAAPAESGPVFPSSPSLNPLETSPTPHQKPGGHITGGSSAAVRAEGHPTSPRSPRSPESQQRRGIVEAAFAPKPTEKPELQTLTDSRGRLKLDAPASAALASAARTQTRSLSRSRSPPPGRFPTGSSQPRSSRIDRILGDQSIPRSAIPVSPSRARASIRTDSSCRSDTLPSPSKAQHPSAIPSSPQRSHKHHSQPLHKSLPSDAFQSKCAGDVASRLRAMHTSPRRGISAHSFDNTNFEKRSGTAAVSGKKLSPSPSPRQHSLSPRKSRPSLSPRTAGATLSPRYIGPTSTSLSPRRASGRSGTRPSSGRSSTRAHNSTTQPVVHAATGKHSQQPPFAPPFPDERIGSASSGGNRERSSNEHPSASYRTLGTDGNDPQASKDPPTSTRTPRAVARDSRKIGSSQEFTKSGSRVSQGGDRAPSVGKRASLGSEKAASSIRSVGDNESEDTSSRDIHSVRNPLRSRLRSTVASSQVRRTSTSAQQSARRPGGPSNIPDAALAQERQFTVLRREARSPRSPVSPAVAVAAASDTARSTTLSGNLKMRASDSSGALSEAEARAWNDAAMASRKLLVAPPGMSLAPASVALPEKSSLSSGKLDTRGIRGPRSNSSPRKSASRLWSSHASSALDHAEEDDADSAVMHGILALGSTVGFISDEYSSSVLEEQSGKPSNNTQKTSSALKSSSKLVSRQPLAVRREKAAQLTAGQEVSVYQTPPSTPSPQSKTQYRKPVDNESTAASTAATASPSGANNFSDYVSAVSDVHSSGTGPGFGSGFCTPTSKLAPESPEHTSANKGSPQTTNQDETPERNLSHWRSSLNKNNNNSPPTEIMPLETTYNQQEVHNAAHEDLKQLEPPVLDAEEPWQAALDSMQEEECRGSAAVAGLSDVADKLQRDVDASNATHNSTHPRRVSALSGLDEVPTLAMLQDRKTTTSEAGGDVRDLRSGLSGGLNSGGLNSGLNSGVSEHTIPQELRMTRELPSDTGDECSERGTATAVPAAAVELQTLPPSEGVAVDPDVRDNNGFVQDIRAATEGVHILNSTPHTSETIQTIHQGTVTIEKVSTVHVRSPTQQAGHDQEGVQGGLEQESRATDQQPYEGYEAAVHESAGSNNVVPQNEPSMSHNDSVNAQDHNAFEDEVESVAHPDAAPNTTSGERFLEVTSPSPESQQFQQNQVLPEFTGEEIRAAASGPYDPLLHTPPEATTTDRGTTEESVASHNPMGSTNGKLPCQDAAAHNSSANGSTTAAGDINPSGSSVNEAGIVCQAATAEGPPTGIATGTANQMSQESDAVQHPGPGFPAPDYTRAHEGSGQGAKPLLDTTDAPAVHSA